MPSSQLVAGIAFASNFCFVVFRPVYRPEGSCWLPIVKAVLRKIVNYSVAPCVDIRTIMEAV